MSKPAVILWARKSLSRPWHAVSGGLTICGQPDSLGFEVHPDPPAQERCAKCVRVLEGMPTSPRSGGASGR